MPASDVADALSVVVVSRAIQTNVVTGRTEPTDVTVHTERWIVLDITQSAVVTVGIAWTVWRVAVLLCKNMTKLKGYQSSRSI